jgi:hypothetical protein
MALTLSRRDTGLADRQVHFALRCSVPGVFTLKLGELMYLILAACFWLAGYFEGGETAPLLYIVAILSMIAQELRDLKLGQK